jgi:hypothetical protein
MTHAKQSKSEVAKFHPDPPDETQVKLLSGLTGAQRVRIMLEARELAVGLIRGRLRRQYPELSVNAINMKVLEEIDRVQDSANYKSF